MNRVLKIRLTDFGVALLAIVAGAAIVYFGDRLLGVRLEYYFGVATFSPIWVLDLFAVPFVAGIVVSLIYGLGGKILAHFSPLIVRIASFYELHHGLMPPEGTIVLPLSFWLLIAVVSAEFAAFGGVVGEIITKKTYGRTANKRLLHKKYQQQDAVGGHQVKEGIHPEKGPIEGIDK